MMTIVLRNRHRLSGLSVAIVMIALLAGSTLAVRAAGGGNVDSTARALKTASRMARGAASTYYLSCHGSDASTGTTKTRPWKTFQRAEKASLAPGDQLLLERGCEWTGDRLDIDWNGTMARPIVISTYGSGTSPLIRNGKNSNVKITGSHLVVRGLSSHFDPFNQTACGQSVGTVYGFNVTGGARDVLLTGNETSGATAGIHLSQNSGRITVSANSIHDNGVMTSFGSNPARDLGAWGILVRSDDNIIEQNLISANRAVCRNQGFKLMSNSIEIYEGSDNLIRYNWSEGDRVFSELGSSSQRVATGNVFSRNVFVTDLESSRFITMHGPKSAYGPVLDTQVRHNTTYQTGAGSEGVVCGSGCSTASLEVRNNILHAQEKVIFADGPIELGPNVVWNTSGEPFVQIAGVDDPADAAFILRNPRFVNATQGDVRLASNSPALDKADRSGTAPRDLDGTPIPASNADIGAFEH